MFEISATELMVIAVVAIVVIGPKDLPDMLRGLGRVVRRMRSMAGDFQRQMDKAGFEDVRKSIEEVRSLTSPTGTIARSITSALEDNETKSVSTQKAVAPAIADPVKTDDGTSPEAGSNADTVSGSADKDAAGPETVPTTIARVSVTHDQVEVMSAESSADAPEAASMAAVAEAVSAPVSTSPSVPAAEDEQISSDRVVTAAKPGDV